MNQPPNITHIITDIEGTTTAIDFVYKSLFPYARAHMSDFLAKRFNDDELQPILTSAKEEAESQHYPAPADLNSANAYAALFKAWMDDDKKVTPLKSLQGLIWEAGYRSGALRGHLYLDAADLLQCWYQAGYQLGIYSSGSVKAQKLLFGHSTVGDLTPLFRHYFDTRIGHKRDPSAYHAIRETLSKDDEAQKSDNASPNVSPLFLSDVVEELDAAREAGFETFGLIRNEPERANTSESESIKTISSNTHHQKLGDHKTANSFKKIDLWLRGEA